VSMVVSGQSYDLAASRGPAPNLKETPPAAQQRLHKSPANAIKPVP